MTTTAGENVLDFTRIICNKFKPKNLFAKRNYYSQVMQNAYLSEYNMMMQNGLDGGLEQQYLVQQQQLQLQQQQQQLVYQQQMNQLNQANQANQLNQLNQFNEINQRNQLNQLNQLNPVGQVNQGAPLNPNVAIQPAPGQGQFQVAPQPIQPTVNQLNQFTPCGNSTLAPPVANPLLNQTMPPLTQPNVLPLSPMINSNQSPLIAQSTLPRNLPAHTRSMSKSNDLSKSGMDAELDDHQADELDPGKNLATFCLPFVLATNTAT